VEHIAMVPRPERVTGNHAARSPIRRLDVRPVASAAIVPLGGEFLGSTKQQISIRNRANAREPIMGVLLDSVMRLTD